MTLPEEPAQPPATVVTTRDGRRLEPTEVNTFPVDPEPWGAFQRAGAVSLDEAGLTRDEYARFTNLSQSGTPWQVVGTPRQDAAVPLPGSFKDAVAGAQKLADALHVGRSWAQDAVGIVAAADGARYAVHLRGYLKPDRLLGADNVKEVFVTEARPELEALVSKSRWVDLRADQPGDVHEPQKLRVLPLVGPLV